VHVVEALPTPWLNRGLLLPWSLGKGSKTRLSSAHTPGLITGGSQGHVSTTGVHKSEKKEVCGQPTATARARARDGSRSRWGALAEQGEAGSGFGRRPLPCQCGPGDIAPVWVSSTASKQADIKKTQKLIR
jgi:hypothetical protein